MPTWPEWQHEVLALLRADLESLQEGISLDDVDWGAFQSFFLEGRTARAAVDRALERDL